MLGDMGRMFATIVSCWGALKTLAVLEPELASEEVSLL